MERTVVLEEYAKNRSRKVGLFKKYGTAILFLLPFLLAFIVFFVFPLGYGVYISLCEFNFKAPGAATFNNFKWYKYLFDSSIERLYFRAFWQSFLNTLIFGIIMVPVAVIVPLALAILINTKLPGYKFFRALIYLPSILPLSASGTVFMLLFLPKTQAGLIDTWFNIDINWFEQIWFSYNLGSWKIDVGYGWIPIFLMCFWGGWGGNFIILCAGLENVPKNLYEACSIDGGTKWDRIKNVTIPGIKGQLVLCLFTTIIGYFGLYGQNYVLTNGYPKIQELGTNPGGHYYSTIQYFIQDIITNSNLKKTMYGLAAAACIVFAIIVGIVSGLQMYLTRDKKSGTKISEAYLKWEKIK